LKLAAIDIGSNAARLLISEITSGPDGTPEFTKVNLIRIPLRLGFEVFEKGIISPQKESQLLAMVKAFKLLMDIYEVAAFRACATSAMRDAVNGMEILDRVKSETGVAIQIISGSVEASLIYENHVAEQMDKSQSYLYIDVGGGSTELTLFSKNTLIFKTSFNIGTIRILQQRVTDELWQDMKDFIKKQGKDFFPITAIGSGGNINKIFSLSKRKEGKPLTLDMLKDYLKEMGSISLEQRIHLYKMREDRADVIVPALQIYVSVMRWAEASEIYVPKIGLVDGLVHSLYQELQLTAQGTLGEI
jgi:exopolyphosphatase/guanosine-5'-triphosphate,3'-diphosphate pyrophosphatase